MNTTRRDFLRLSALAGAGACLLPKQAWAAPSRGPEDPRLVLIFLDGGNDGLNTVVPYADDLYHKARPQLGLQDVIRLDDATGLHPSLKAWQELFDKGSLSILQGIGYDRPDLSHFTSRDIWHSGWRDRKERVSGWAGRSFETLRAQPALPPVAMGTSEAPLLLKSSRTTGLTMRDLSSLQLESVPKIPEGGAVAGPLARIGQASRMAYRTADRLRIAAEKVPPGEGYPDSALGDRLRLAARLVRAEGGPPICWTKLGGFDTHALQPGAHAALLQQLGDATAALHRDLAQDGSDRKTLILVYSEFGRRVAENGSAGTDHGTAGPVFALGGGVKPGTHGKAPDLENLDQGNLRHQIDFRAVFSEALRDWMGWSAQGLFDGGFEDGQAQVGFLRSSV